VPSKKAICNEGAQRANCAGQRETEQQEQNHCYARAAQRPDKESERRAAGSSARQGTKDHCRIEGQGATPEPPEMTAQPRRVIPLSVSSQQFRRMRDMIGYASKPSVEQITT
jgi:hypothetical protein